MSLDSLIKKICKLFKPSYLSRKTNERMHYPRCTFLGDTMSQSFSSLFLWENVLSEVEFARFVELGTGNGTLSRYLYLFCLNKDVQFLTFDVEKKYTETKIKSFLNLDDVFTTHNVLDSPELIRKVIKKEGRTILLCDNGNKMLEFELYAPHLKKGDFICAHDWNEEIEYKSISDIVKRNNLKMIYERLCVKSFSHIRIFEKC